MSLAGDWWSKFVKWLVPWSNDDQNATQIVLLRDPMVGTAQRADPGEKQDPAKDIKRQETRKARKRLTLTSRKEKPIPSHSADARQVATDPPTEFTEPLRPQIADDGTFTARSEDGQE